MIQPAWESDGSVAQAGVELLLMQTPSTVGEISAAFIRLGMVEHNLCQTSRGVDKGIQLDFWLTSFESGADALP